MGRESSGTAWQPDTSEHRGLMVDAAGWTLMGMLTSTWSIAAKAVGAATTRRSYPAW
jgi:hypothetical protein